MAQVARERDGELIAVQKEYDLRKLVKWLSNRQYNTINKNGRDKRDQPMIGLMYQNEKGHTHRRGLIVCRNEGLHAKALSVVSSMQQKER